VFFADICKVFLEKEVLNGNEIVEKRKFQCCLLLVDKSSSLSSSFISFIDREHDILKDSSNEQQRQG